MRRYLWVLFVSYLLIIAVVSGSTYLSGQAGKQQEKDAKSITVYTALPLEQIEPLAQDFESSQGIRVNIVPLSENDLITRVNSEKSTPQADLVLANQSVLEQLKTAKALLPYTSEQTDIIPHRFVDKDNYWTGIWYDPIVFAVNRDFLKKMPQPLTKWTNLVQASDSANVNTASHENEANPASQPDNNKDVHVSDRTTTDAKLATKPAAAVNNLRVGITDFLASEASANLLYTLVSVNGENQTLAFFKQLHPHIVQYAKFLATPVRMAALSEVDIAIAVQSEAMRYVRDNFPLTILYPEEGTAYLLTGAALVKDSSHSAEAKQFLEWLIQDHAQAVLQKNKLYFIPANPANQAYKEYEAQNIKLLENRVNDREQQRQLLDRWVATVRLNTKQ
ncbi:hypothetical protein P22_2247 [Propionispora sp. 2/2-37]|uniref:ABC transporter substrate-binding protein n=1 Tax=Propionispora sp. 2/2-37 TaxID=1677858 RepID=UPI0006BB5428|nr:extracellular solute-binding protein [Propionispora sp. 2/2-37]CUH96159.1 hypothetical protein P22_2247 [Propionispora sp. 2/2-37]